MLYPPFNKEQYTWDGPSNEFYKADTSGTLAVMEEQDQGDFAAARDALDWDYHAKPLPPRRRMQDQILTKVMAPGATKRESPWVVFTAGAMGAGKSHALLSLHTEGLFPLDQFQ